MATASPSPPPAWTPPRPPPPSPPRTLARHRPSLQDHRVTVERDRPVAPPGPRRTAAASPPIFGPGCARPSHRGSLPPARLRTYLAQTDPSTEVAVFASWMRKERRCSPLCHHESDVCHSGYHRLERQSPGGYRTSKEHAPFHGTRVPASLRHGRYIRQEPKSTVPQINTPPEVL